MAEDPWKRPAFAPAIFCRDPRETIDWLERAFGFRITMVITNDKGQVEHAELAFGDSVLFVGGEWTDWAKSPASLGGANTQTVHVHIKDDVDAHCRRARAAGAVIVMEPEDQFYGDRVYRCTDPEGRQWTISQSVRFVSREDAEAATGLKIEGWVEPPGP